MTLEPYCKCILSHSSREQLIIECPAFALYLYQHIVATLGSGSMVPDPFVNSSRQDGVTQLLSARSLSEVFRLIFDAPTAPTSGMAEPDPANILPRELFWKTFRKALESSWMPRTGLDFGNSTPTPGAVPSDLLLVHLAGRPHFSFPVRVPDLSPDGIGIPLTAASLRNALKTSRRFLRSATTCALAGSLAPLGEGKTHHALGAILQLRRLVPPAGAAEDGRVTAEGLNFCLMPLPQQWWVLVSGAMDRVLAIARATPSASEAEVTMPRLWQLLAILAALDGVRYMYAFPSKTEDLAGYLLLARLAEVGLAYPVQTTAGSRCFVLSPHFHHALGWRATAPLCLTAMLHDDAAAAANARAVRREDTDTIITETNFRLYAYTRNPDLIRILDQFAVREEEVEGLLLCYRITRESFAAALRKGLTAAQILQFLSLRAHPSMLQKYGTKDGDLATASTSTTGREGPVIRTGAASEADAADSGFAIPQSLCDQLYMWESECNRVVFKKHLVLLKCLSSDQQRLLQDFLGEMGKSDAIVHMEPGYMVLHEEVYNQFIAGAVAEVQ
ncbi:unnamed protein product [Phytomonas sp. EM1]|nr:unnamed protein product [Phytomonas sp. EM1]|eukprot:CCW59967.1 unnamed protein product [Phytomonas sp. isolate EM1]